MTVKAVTFNLRMPDPSDGINYFFNRAPHILHTIKEETPDVIGFQEAKEPIYDWLKASLPEYVFVGIGRETDFSDEANPIAFRRDRFELADFTQFWLSPTPYTPGSRYEEQSTCPRILCAALLKESCSTRMFWFYNTHLDHVGEKARLLGMGQVLEQIRRDHALRPHPLLLTGDMNAQPSEACICAALRMTDPALTDVTADVKTSFHGFRGGAWQDGNDKIDYIFTWGICAVSPVSVWDGVHNGIYLSDHYPLAVTVTL